MVKPRPCVVPEVRTSRACSPAGRRVPYGTMSRHASLLKAGSRLALTQVASKVFNSRGRSNDKRPIPLLDLPIFASYLSPDVVCNLWPHARSGARYDCTLELAMRLASRSPSATRSGSRRWPTRARSVVVHLLFNVFAPVGEGPAQRAQAAHATRRASKVGSVHAAERTAETTPSPTALERSWFWGRAASLPACAPCGAPCMLRAVCVSGVEAGALERVGPRLTAGRHRQRALVVLACRHERPRWSAPLRVHLYVVWKICIIIHSLQY